jgi:uncharacterized protein (TIGR02646 family)
VIHVDRSTVPVPDILIFPDAAGPQETLHAIQHYAGKAKGKKKRKKDAKAFPFRVYKDDAVKAALEKLFHGKCAYCEFPYPAAHPMDVEHWRPKGAVQTNDGKVLKSGYYWLAATWENLLPSCINCNRESGHYQPGSPDRKVKSGKKTLFPLADETKRRRKHTDKKNEVPLLLNPCEDIPEDHLEFPGDEKSAGIVRARKIAGKDSLKGRSSIDVYGLIRQELMRARIEHYKVMASKMTDVDRWSEVAKNAATDEERRKYTAWRDEALEALKAMRDPQKQFAQMARQIIDPFLHSRNL